LRRLPAEALRAGFRRACRGEAVLALCYEPEPGCFYAGTDPLQAALQIPSALAFAVEPVTPWAALADLDPYHCNLRFLLLTDAPRTEVEQSMRYELDRLTITPLAARDLVHVVGAASEGPVWDDFREAASAQHAAGDFAALRATAASLRRVTGPSLWRADALGWLDEAASAPVPDRDLVAALIDAAGTGRLAETVIDETPAAVAATAGPGMFARVFEGANGTIARGILGGQRQALGRGGYDEGRLASVAAVIGNVLLGLGLGGRLDAFRLAVADTRACRSTLPLLTFLDALESGAAAEAAPDSGTAAPDSGTAAADAAPVAAARPEAPARSAGTETRAPQKTLKVEQAKIDLLMNLIGELVVSKNSLPFLAKRAETYGSREMSREIKEQYAVIDRLAQEMQGAIMQVQMLPVSDIFDRFPRLVRDLARKLGKQIELAVEGEDTAADKTIIEALGDPLLHIVRNSLDHGIEQPDLRRAAGKPPTARLRLRACQEADGVVIEVSDDGCGIDPARIRAIAIEKGLVDAEEAARLSDQEAINLIYRPGFSTVREISDLSGRGVGMDVVLTTVEKLGGRVAVTSRLGEGTTTRLVLPLSMAVTRVMVVEAADGVYGVPMDMIAETVRVPESRIQRIKRAEAFVLRNIVIPLVRMSTLLGVPARRRTGGAEAEEAVLVCQIDGRHVGLVIDDFREGMDVILKPLQGALTGLRGYSGTALLGDGRVLLVLDLKELL
ncbi:MAG: chemotaxis protein CheA, partial [Methylobacterium sp.]|uniref:chemotaxis protein CheA n=1 Tax=Methylobacterium sp. TaxID=409 RepID=UPI0027188B0F